ncbi:amidohydrolase family protein [Micromonospora sp. NPDC050200]|uniref:amidohydrolase family protein n=1 Tax=Micromonospora sp. NPDC050200 TaxID=3155664 RepID=UPI0033DCFBC6
MDSRARLQRRPSAPHRICERDHQVSLGGARSISEVLDRLAAAARHRPVGAWIVAHGHDETRLAENRRPRREELDAACPAHPVVVRRSCSHLSVANSAALAAARIGEDTPDPPGDHLVRYEGRLTGVLLERAQMLVKRHMPRPALDWPRALGQAARRYHARGITSVTEASAGNAAVADAELLAAAVRAGDLPLRLHLMPRGACLEKVLADGQPEPDDDWASWDA